MAARHRGINAVVVGFAVCLLHNNPIAQTVANNTPQGAERSESIARSIEALRTRIDELEVMLSLALPRSAVTVLSPIELEVGDSAVLGADSARIALIEFSDFECPFCAQHSRTVYQEIRKRFVETGLVKYVFRHLPIDKLHPRALKAAEAAECARAQGRFWELHDRMFENQKELDVAAISGHAKAVGLELGTFQECLSTPRVASKVQADLAEAARFGLTGTPAFLVGEIEKDRIVVTRQITGAQPFHVFRAVLDSALSARPVLERR